MDYASFVNSHESLAYSSNRPIDFLVRQELSLTKGLPGPVLLLKSQIDVGWRVREACQAGLERPRR